MKPAFSVIFLTTLSGAGQGLFIAVCLLPLFGADSLDFAKRGALVAAALAGLGLFASFFHLGRLGPSWRAASQWRTSWLSREVIALPAFIAGCVACYFFPTSVVVGTLTLLACIFLFVCTAMIYACLKFLQEWASPLTVANFMLMGMASGFTLAAALHPDAFLRNAAIVLTLAALGVRLASLARNRRLRPKSTLQSALGVKHPRIEQKSMGFMGGSFNTREFFHGRSREAMVAIRYGFLLFAFVLPLGLLIFEKPAAAFVIQYLGLLAERWYFFAEANHPQNLYYQAIA